MESAERQAVARVDIVLVEDVEAEDAAVVAGSPNLHTAAGSLGVAAPTVAAAAANPDFGHASWVESCLVQEMEISTSKMASWRDSEEPAALVKNKGPLF